MKVLMIDDKPHEIELLLGAIEETGPVEFTALSAGIDAMNLLATMQPRQFDLILLDWRLPGISGDQIAKAYVDRNDRDQRVPLVFLSTAIPPDARSYAQQSGCFVLEKPMDLCGYEELARYLRSLGSHGLAV